jgi:hypothetical protein
MHKNAKHIAYQDVLEAKLTAVLADTHVMMAT